jgi:hypothetical protein
MQTTPTTQLAGLPVCADTASEAITEMLEAPG